MSKRGEDPGAARPMPPGGEAALLVAEALSLGYAGRVVLGGVGLAVRRGEFWFLLGPNGSGKSTFARAVLGFLRPTAGRLDVSASLAFVPQHCALHPTLATTLREYVSLGLGSLRLPRAECAQRTEWAIEAVGLAGRTASDVHSLSGGMRQRAMVARALVRRPELLVLDEPTSNLDPASQEALLDVLARLRRESGLTMLFVCHDVAEAVRHATHVALFEGGTVVPGPRALLFERGRLERLYGAGLRVHQDSEGHASLEIAADGGAS